MSPWQKLEVKSGAQLNPLPAYFNAAIDDNIWLTNDKRSANAQTGWDPGQQA